MTTALERPLVGAPDGRVGVVRASALYIAAVLGTGILVLPGLTASVAGPGSILAVVAVFVLSIPLAGTFAALAARFPDAGGVATFVRLALGPTAARMAGYWFYFGVAVGAPVVGVLGAEYLVAVTGAERWVTAIVAVAVFAPPFVANAFGVRVSGAAQLVLTGALVLVVIIVVAFSLPAIESRSFAPLLPHGWGGVGAAVSLFVWAFAGWEAVTHISSEFRNPRRTIPIATGVAVVVVGVAYLALQVVTVGVLAGGAGDSAVPLLDLVAAAAPSWASPLVAGIAIVVAVGVLNAYLPAFANLGASLGRDGDLPKWMAKGAEGGGVPRRALAITAAIVAAYLALVIASDFELEPFILVHTSTMVAVYALGMVSAVRLLERFTLGWWMAVASVVLVGGLLLLAGGNLLAPAALAAVAVAVTVVKRGRGTSATEAPDPA